MKKVIIAAAIALLIAVASVAVLESALDVNLPSTLHCLFVTEKSPPPSKASENGSPYKFYYETLGVPEKYAYNSILDDIYEMPELILVPHLDKDQLDDVFLALIYDNPDLFFIGRKCTVVSRMGISLFSVDYLMDKDEYQKRKSALDEAAEKVLASIPESDDQWQTELAIHDYIVNNCSYHMEGESASYSTPYGVFIDGKASCEGYSKAAKLLLDAREIENGIVCGDSVGTDGKKAPHMWNAVKINGSFCHLDCTWDDPVNLDESHGGVYTYFNLSDEAVGATHSNFSYDYHCDSDDESYYSRTGSFFSSFSSADEQRVMKLIEKGVLSGNDRVQLRFANKKVYDSAMNSLIKKGGIYELLLDVKNLTKKDISTDSLTYLESEDQLTLILILNN